MNRQAHYVMYDTINCVYAVNVMWLDLYLLTLLHTLFPPVISYHCND